ncbi:MAG: threonine synthase [Thermoprotei archaeon]
MCINCGTVFEPNPWLFKCPKCDSLLEVKYSVTNLSWDELRKRPLRVWRYKELLPHVKNPISLDEGGTPLIHSNMFDNVYIKFEGTNPTGSFKDRGMTVAITIAKEAGVKSVIVASTGNTAASASAYAARAGLQCYVFIPQGAVAQGKLAQVSLHGAKIIEVQGNFDKALEMVIDVVSSKTIYPLNSFNPWRLEGQKTIAFEIYDQLGCPDWVVVPVGNAGNISAIWKGFKELKELGLCNKLPKMVGVQAEGASPLATAWMKKLERALFIENPETIATAIRIGKPVNWPKAWKAVKESDGLFITVTDHEITSAQKLLARRDGIGAEPAGAASIAGLKKLIEQNIINREELTVAIVTAHALKDPSSTLNGFSIMKANQEELLNLMRGDFNEG